mgnify:CR=1 FL=1
MLDRVGERFEKVDTLVNNAGGQFPAPLEAALMRAWNTWASEMCKKSPEHLAFGAVVPVRDPGLAVREMRHAKELGACTVMVLPTAGRHHLHERFLDPFWAEAQHLDEAWEERFGRRRAA